MPPVVPEVVGVAQHISHTGQHLMQACGHLPPHLGGVTEAQRVGLAPPQLTGGELMPVRL